MKNNKGVTLVELLIVIVVMGIIAAFAVPSVQTIVTNTRRSAAYADALAVEQAADLYCADTLCSSTEALKWTALDPYVEGVAAADLDLTGDPDIAVLDGSGNWQIYLELAGTGGYEFTAGMTPSLTDRDSSITVDAD